MAQSDGAAKIRIGVIFGGRSAEHEVSLASGAGIMGRLDRERYEVLPVLVTREGRWRLLPRPEAEPGEGREAFLFPRPGEFSLQAVGPTGSPEPIPVDVFFPITHGTYGEDGTLQGLLELTEIPFVGSSCFSSALAMNKAAAKKVLLAAGLSALPAAAIPRERWEAGRKAVLQEIHARIGYPLFVKPVSLGSSVGIHQIEGKDEEALDRAVRDALTYDHAVLIEADAEGREIECAVLEDSAGAPLLASPLAEIRPKEGWYDYEAKYTEGKTDILIPAPLPEDVAERIRAQAGAAFSALGCSGLARVDFFFREESGEIFVSELNTLPGFTPMSAYPMMIEATGIPYPTMLDRLIACALSRHKRNEARNFRRLG
jgi:D-alanine-D-alanine ligase